MKVEMSEAKKMREELKMKGKLLVLEINEDYGKTTAACVLEDLGYDCIPEYDEAEDRDGWKVTVEGKEYWFKEWDHYNGYVYSITLEEA